MKSYTQYTVRDVKGRTLTSGCVPSEQADAAIVRAFKAYREAAFVTSFEVLAEDGEAEEASPSHSFLEANLLASDGSFIMRAYFPSEEEYEAEIASLMRACPSAVSVFVREVS